MPITRIKSTVQAPPTNNDVSAVIRSIRGDFVNMSADVMSRLQVGEARTQLSMGVITDHLFTEYLTYNVLAGGSPRSGSDFGILQKVTFGCNAATNGITYIRARQSTPFMPGNVSILNQTFSYEHSGLSTEGLKQSIRVGLMSEAKVGGDLTGSNGGVAFVSQARLTSGEQVESRYLSMIWGNATSDDTMVPQSDWNIDTLQTSDDIDNNPSRTQIDWSGVVQLTAFIDFPNSVIVGFTYDGVFLPAHRFYIEDVESLYSGFLYQPRYCPAWQMVANEGNANVFPKSFNVSMVGSQPTKGPENSDYSGLVSVAAGATEHLISILNAQPDSCNIAINRVGGVSVGGAVANLLVCKNSVPTTAGGYAQPPGDGQTPNYVQTRKARGAITDYGLLLKSRPFAANADIGDFGMLTKAGSTTTGTPNGSSGEWIEVYAHNPNAGAIEVGASVDWQVEV